MQFKIYDGLHLLQDASLHSLFTFWTISFFACNFIVHMFRFWLNMTFNANIKLCMRNSPFTKKHLCLKRKETIIYQILFLFFKYQNIQHFRFFKKSYIFQGHRSLKTWKMAKAIQALPLEDKKLFHSRQPIAILA